MHIDIDILVYAIIAAVLLGRLWAVLGSRNDNETQRPNPFTPPPPKASEQDAAFSPTPSQASPSRLTAFAPPPASLAGGFAQIFAAIPTFNEKQFLLDARSSFTTIVETYATGTMNNVSSMLAPALLAHFQAAADARTSAGQMAQTKVIRIKDAEAIAARADTAQAFVTVRFVSDQENILRDTKGTILGGTEGVAEEVTDTWVFARDLQAPEGKWVVVETRD